MKKRVFAVLLSLTLAGSFVACGGSKEGAETETVADESISDLSVASAVSGTESNVGSTGTTTAAETPAVPADESTSQTAGEEIITPIPAVNLTDGSQVVQETPADGTAATDENAAADSSSSKKMIVTADINVREEADIEGDILGGYEEGEEITVLGSEGNWYIVEYNGETGYVNANYVEPAGSSSSSSDEDDEDDEEVSSDSAYSEYGKLIDGDGDPVDLRYYDGSYEIYDEDGNVVIIEGVND